MPVTTETVVTIVCDNPACPGNDLDSHSYEGWISLQATVQQTVEQPDGESFSMPTSAQTIYCSPTCAGTIEDALVEAEEARNASVENELPEATKTTRKKKA